MAVADVHPVISEVGRLYLRLHLTDAVGPVRLRKLTEALGSIDAVLGASAGQLERVDGIGRKTAERILRSAAQVDVDSEIDRATSRDVHILCPEDRAYPPLLLHTADPPLCLFVRGQIEPTDGVAVAIVGTRRCSHYGREQAIRFAGLLGGAGFTVVSGLARGVDGHAHRGALDSGGRSIAVLGCGLGTVYPSEHEALAEDVARSGAVISELPIEVAPNATNFPKRNRIIAGLSLGVIIIEAGKKSGAQITARLANECNREVFALPGRVDRPEQTAGVHALIRDGQAKLITCLEDVLDELGDVGRTMHPTGRRHCTGEPNVVGTALPIKLTTNEQLVLTAVEQSAGDADSIVGATPLETAVVMSSLTSLQLKGAIRRLPDGRFEKRG